VKATPLVNETVSAMNAALTPLPSEQLAKPRFVFDWFAGQHGGAPVVHDTLLHLWLFFPSEHYARTAAKCFNSEPSTALCCQWQDARAEYKPVHNPNETTADAEWAKHNPYPNGRWT
jgi:hypothetical protein